MKKQKKITLEIGELVRVKDFYFLYLDDAAEQRHLYPLCFEDDYVVLKVVNNKTNRAGRFTGVPAEGQSVLNQYLEKYELWEEVEFYGKDVLYSVTDMIEKQKMKNVLIKLENNGIIKRR